MKKMLAVVRRTEDGYPRLRAQVAGLRSPRGHGGASRGRHHRRGQARISRPARKGRTDSPRIKSKSPSSSSRRSAGTPARTARTRSHRPIGLGIAVG